MKNINYSRRKLILNFWKIIIRFFLISMFSMFFLSNLDFFKNIFKKDKNRKFEKSDYFSKFQNTVSPRIVNIFRSSQFCWRGMDLLFRFLALMNTYKRILATGLVDFGTWVVSRISRNSRIRSALGNREESICHSSSFFMFVGWYVPESPEIFSF